MMIMEAHFHPRVKEKKRTIATLYVTLILIIVTFILNIVTLRVAVVSLFLAIATINHNVTFYLKM